MKLKLVVATMGILGLVNCNVFAATQAHHKHHHHKANKPMTTEAAQYKDMGALAEVCPKVDMYDAILDSMSHNVGRAKPSVHCTDPLSLAGGIAFDSTWGNRHRGYSGENTRRFSLNDAYLNVYGNVNEWTQAFASLSYAGFSPTTSSTQHQLNGAYTNSYPSDTFSLQQAFITFKNKDVTPVFVRVGKMFEDFGRYNIHPMTESVTQVMSESLHTSAQVGFMTPMGLNGSLYTFQNPLHRSTLPPAGTDSNGHNQNNWGASINFNQPNEQFGYDLGVGYIYDFTGIDQIAYGVTQFNASGTNSSGYNGYYQTRVSGGTLYGDVNSGPFTLALRYVTALKSFSAFDLATKAYSIVGTSGTGAKPWSGDLTAGYGFNAWGKNQNVYLGYQATGNAVNLYLPKSRWLAGYGVNVWKNTDIGVQINHDLPYSRTSSNENSNTSTNLVVLRAAVQFG